MPTGSGHASVSTHCVSRCGLLTVDDDNYGDANDDDGDDDGATDGADSTLPRWVFLITSVSTSFMTSFTMPQPVALSSTTVMMLVNMMMMILMTMICQMQSTAVTVLRLASTLYTVRCNAMQQVRNALQATVYCIDDDDDDMTMVTQLHCNSWLIPRLRQW